MCCVRPALAATAPLGAGWLGISFAIPTKRLLINQEMLRFPSG
jgi:uncharacterized oligopeptide transporter (OPT) family protein